MTSKGVIFNLLIYDLNFNFEVFSVHILSPVPAQIEVVSLFIAGDDIFKTKFK